MKTIKRGSMPSIEMSLKGLNQRKQKLLTPEKILRRRSKENFKDLEIFLRLRRKC